MIAIYLSSDPDSNTRQIKIDKKSNQIEINDFQKRPYLHDQIQVSAASHNNTN